MSLKDFELWIKKVYENYILKGKYNEIQCDNSNI